MKAAVIDARGAGIGKTIIKKIRKEIGDGIYIVALGTNTIATSNMVKAGANVGVTGESSICHVIIDNDIDCIIGPIGIMCSGGIEGEITSNISEAIFKSTCIKYIIPLKKHGIYIPGTRQLEIKDMIDEIINDIKKCKENIQ